MVSGKSPVNPVLIHFFTYRKDTDMEKKFIVLPVNDEKPVKRCFIRDGETLLNDFTIALDFDTPRMDVYVDVTRFGCAFTLTDEEGKPVAYRTADRLPTVDEIPGGDVLRPAAHFTTTLGWINDPNGLIYVNGRYHLFYQHNPTSVNWGNMTWGHAVSEDLVHWTELGDALFPDETGTMFSGSAVCDERNVSGLGEGAILLYYTAAGGNSVQSKDVPFTQCLAYSTDNGETFTKYEKNPIISHIIGGNRDPKVQWSDELGRYTLSLYLDGAEYCIFASDNLLDWEKIADVHTPLDNECPDFYPLCIENAVDGGVKWVFSGAHDSYIIGEIKDGTFVPEQDNLPYHIGPGCSYAAQSYSGTGDRRIKIPWGQNRAPGAVFNSQMGIPTEMFLKNVDGTIRLGSLPVKEAELLECSEWNRNSFSGKCGQISLGKPVDKAALRVKMTIDPASDDFTFSCFGMEIRFSPKNNTYTHGECTAPLTYDGDMNVDMIFDTLGAEIFADNGLIYSTIGRVADRTGLIGISLDGWAKLTVDYAALSMDKNEKVYW